jgi:non-specific protein-tyrosine kinase
MEIRQLWQLLWKWLWLVILSTALAAAGAYVASQYVTPIYRATTTLLISEPTTTAETAEYTTLLASERLARSYAERLTNRHVLEQTIATTGLATTPEALEELIDVQLVRDTQLIELSVEHPNPSTAMLVANEIPKAFSARNQEQQSNLFVASKSSLEEEMAGIEAEIAELEQQLAPYDGLEGVGRPAALDQRITELQTAHSALLSTYEEVRIAEIQSLSNVIIDEESSLPTIPIRPRVLLNTALAGIIGAMLAVGVVTLVEYLDDTLKDPESVAQVLNVATVALIPNLKRADKEPLVVVSQPRSPGAESFRALRTNIQYASVDKTIRSVLVTSPRERDGKTLVAANLAAVIALTGKEVILVDTDLRRPMMSQLFRLREREGVTDALFLPDFGQLTAWSSPVKKLKILPSGTIPPNPSELLGSERMHSLATFLSQNVDFVVFDSPPLLAVTDASLLSTRVDGVVLVMEAGRSRRDEGLRAIDSLNKVGANVLGVVLNKVRGRGRGYYDYYRYYGTDEPASNGVRRTSIVEQQQPNPRDFSDIP